MSISYLALIITGLLGIIGLLTKTSTDDKKNGNVNRLTPFGIITLLLLIVAFGVSIWNQYATDQKTERDKVEARHKQVVDSLQELLKFTALSSGQKNTIDRLQAQKQLNLIQIAKDSERFNITLANFGRQLNAQSATLFNVQRNLVPIKDVYFTGFITIPLDGTQELMAYKQRLKDGIKGLLPALETHRPVPDWVEGSSAGKDGKISTVMISSKSPLWPTGSSETTAAHLFGGIDGELLFYKTPISFGKLPYMGYNKDKIMPDLTIPIGGADDDKASPFIQCDVATDKVLLVETGLKSNPEYWTTNAHLISILDLANAQVFIRLNNTAGPKQIIHYCSIQINAFTINLWEPNLSHLFDSTRNQAFFSYVFPTDMNLFLAKGVKKPRPSDFTDNN